MAEDGAIDQKTIKRKDERDELIHTELSKTFSDGEHNTANYFAP